MSSLPENIGLSDQTVFITSDLDTGETPMFNPLDGCFYYVDIQGGDIHQYDPHSKSSQKWHLDKGMVGGVVVNHDGTLIGNAQKGLFAFDPKSGSLAMLRPIEPDKPNNRPNDMNIFELSDGTTRIAIGCIPIDRTSLKPGEKPGVVYVVKPETFELKPVFDNHVTSNALCGFNRNGENIIFLAETDKNHNPTVWRATYNAQTDEIENVSVFLTRDRMHGGRPDGASIIEIDGRKAVAIAILDTNNIIAFDVDTAEPVAMVAAPKNLTLTHAAFGPDDAGKTVCLITSSRRHFNNVAMPGVAVLVPVRAETVVKSLAPVATGYPSFAEMTAGKSIELIKPEAVTGMTADSNHPSPKP